MTEIIVSILYIIGLATAVIIPMVTIGNTRKYLLDKEDEILHELTACRKD